MFPHLATYPGMSKHPEMIPEADFTKTVLSSPVPVYVDFTASWCAPCRALAPILGNLSEESGGKYRVVAVDGDEATTIAAKYSVRAFPTVILFSEGKEVTRHVGLASKERLLSLLNNV